MSSSAKIGEAAAKESVTKQASSQPGAPLFDFLDLKAQFATIRDEVMDAVTRVMESQHFILGSEVKAFEDEVAAMLGAKHAIGCASGSDALVLALMAAGIGNDDEVITTPFSFFATAGSIARVGAKPVFVDIDPVTFNIDTKLIEEAITPRTKAIMPVHLFGLSADLGPIMELAGPAKLAVIEDAAQAIGAKYREKLVGVIGTSGCFSFFPSKNLGGAGDGGMVSTDDELLAEKLRVLRVHGSKKRYHHEVLGTNSRLDSLQAAILRVKLGHLEGWTRGRQKQAECYRVMFEEMNLDEFVSAPPAPPSEYRHVYNQFSIRCKHRDELREHMRVNGIPTEVYYPICLHLQPAFSYLGYHAGSFPESEAASEEVLALPVYPELPEQQLQLVVQTIAGFYSSRR